MKFTRLATAMIMCTASLPIFAASYTVTELPTQSVSQNQYAGSIDNTGLILTAAQNYFNLPIDLSLIDFENETIIANLTDIESARSGNFNDADYSYLVNRALTGTQNFSLFTQQLSDFLGFKTDGTSFDYVNAFDTETEALSGYSYSMSTVLRDSVAGTHIIGNTVGPFRTIDYVNEAAETIQYVVSDFDQRAFVQVGDNVSELLPVDVSLGGISSVSSINDNYTVVGTGSVSGTELLELAVENCADLDIRGDQPKEACDRRIITVSTGTSVVRRNGLWLQRAHVWSLDAAGNVIDTNAYGTLLTEEGQELLGTSQAVDINNADIAVGVSTVQVEGSTQLSTAGAIFQNGEITQVLEGNEFLPNSAIAINDPGYIVGVQVKIINQAQRSKMFVYNMNNQEFAFPEGFFASSSNIPRAMSNNNIVVGAGDIEGITSTRRTAAFIYDIDTDIFLDLNGLISCTNQAEFNLIEAVDVNDSGDIVATAIVKRANRNAKGELFKDENGEDIIVDAWVTVKLSPTDNPPETCSDEEAGVVERQGASTGLVLFWMLLAATIFRRSSFMRK